MTVLEARGLRKTYVGGDGATIAVLDGIDLAVHRGEMVAIIGASGARKSTLLIIALTLTDLPAPVAPAMSRWGIGARSLTNGSPWSRRS